MTDTAAPEKGQALVFCSGALFFTHVIEWPEGVAEAELTALVELCLEDISPFSLESLAWGFCSDAASRTVFLYAACLPRIPAVEQEQWPLAEHVYPAFLPLLVSRSEGTSETVLPRRELLLSGREVLLIERAAGSRWPHRIVAESLEREAPDEGQEALAAAQRLLQKVSPANGSADVADLLNTLPFWQLVGNTVGRRGQIRFALRPFGGVAHSAASGTADSVPTRAAGQTAKGEHPSAGADDSAIGHAADGEYAAPVDDTGSAAAHGETAPSAAHGESAPSAQNIYFALEGEEAIWQADLRTEGFIELARKQRLMGLRLWYGLCAAVAAAVLLLLMLLAFGWLGVVLENRTEKLAAQSPAVERVRQDQDLLMRMRQFSAEPFAPFGLIAALKATKPDALYFDSIELTGPDSVVVEGQGPTVDAVNAYVRSLEQSSAFRSARQARMNLKDGVSVFTLYLQYVGPPLVAVRGQSTGTVAQDSTTAATQAAAAPASLPAAAPALAAPARSAVQQEAVPSRPATEQQASRSPVRAPANAPATPVAEDWDVTMSSEVIVTRFENPLVLTANADGTVVVGQPAAASQPASGAAAFATAEDDSVDDEGRPLSERMPPPPFSSDPFQPAN